MRLRPLALRALGACAALLLLFAVLVEQGLLRGFLRARFVEQLAQAGLAARIESLEVSLLRREVVLRGLSIGPPATAPLATARLARARFPVAALFGKPAVDAVEVEGLVIDVRRGAPGAPSAAPTTAPEIGRLTVRDAELRFRDETQGIEVVAVGLSLEAAASPHGMSGSLRAAGAVRVRAADRTFEPRLSDVPLALERGEWRFGPLTVTAPEARFRIVGLLKAAAAEPQLELNLDGEVDLARALAGEPRLGGTLRVLARVSGPAAAPAASVTFRSARIESGGRVLEDLLLRGQASGPGLDVASFSARLAGGSLLGRGHFGWDEGASEAHLEWSGLELGALLEKAPVARLSGRLDAAWPAARWREARAKGRLEARAAGAPDAALTLDGTARAELEKGAWRLDLERLRAADVELTGELRGRWGERIAESPLTGTLALRADDLGRSGRALAKTTRVAGSATAALQIAGTLGSPQARFRIEARDIALLELPIQPARLSAEGSLARGAAELSSLALEAAGLACRGSGRVDLASGRLSGQVSAKLDDIAAFREAVPAALDPSGAATATATLGGTWRAPAAAVELQAGALRLAGQTFASAQGQATASNAGLAIESLEVAPHGGGRVRVSGRIAAGAPHQTELQVEAEDADLTDAARAQAPAVSRALLSLQAALRGSLSEPERLAVDAHLLRLELDVPAAALRLDRPARLVKGRAEIVVEDLRIRSGATALEASGRLGGATTEGLRASLQGRLEDLAAWLPAASALKTLRGPIDATFRATGDADRPQLAAHVEAKQVAVGGSGEGAAAGFSADVTADAPSLARLRGDVAVSGIRLEAEGTALEQQGAGRIAIEGGVLQLSGFEWRGAGSELRAGGSVRLGGGEAPLDTAALDLRAAGQLDLRLAGALAPGLEGGGAASLDLSLRGSGAAPDLRGQVVLDGALLRYRPKRLSLDGISGRLVLGDGRLELEGVSGSVNGGSFEARGSLTLLGLRPAQGRVELIGKGATLDWPRGFTGELDAGLALEAGGGETTLSGEVTLASGSYKGNPRVLYLELEEWRAQPSQPSVLDPLRFDLRVRTLEDVHADTIYGRLDLSADVKVGGRFASPELQGRIQAAPGAQFFVGGRTYDVETLTLDYTKAGGLVPLLRSRAGTRVQANRVNYSVTADFQGPLDAPEARLRSDPPLTEREIASLLTTGRTSAGVASTDAMGLVLADVLGGVGRTFGLDTVRLEGDEGDELLSDPLQIASEANPHSRLTLTKRLGADLEVTLSQALAGGGKRTTLISYRPVRGLLARATQSDEQTYGFELRHDLALGDRRPPEPARDKRPERRSGRVGSVRLRVEGGLAERELLPRLRLREGQRFDYHRWLLDRDRLQEALAQAGFFEARVFATREPRADRDAAPDTQVQLSYRVLSGPRTALVFLGYSAPAELRGQVERAWWLSEYASSIEEEAVRLTLAFLIDRGHVAARVEALTAEGRAAEPWKRLTVRVQPGAQARRREILFPGRERLPAERLRGLVGTDEARRSAFRDPASLARSVVKLARSEGLLAAEADARVVLRGDVAVLEVAIDEGRPFTIDEVAVTGRAGLTENEVREAARLEAGGSFREALLDDARERVRRLLRSRGFALASVKIDGRIDAEQARVDVTIDVSAGPRQVLQEIVVDGEIAPAGRRLAAETGLQAGQPVVADEWSLVRRRLFDTGLFRRVELQAEPIDAAEAASGETQPVRARLTLEDWPRMRFRYGLQLAGTRDPLDEEGRQQFRLGGIAEATRQTLFGRALGSSVSGQAREGFLLGRGVLSLPRAFKTPLRSSVYLTRTHVDRPFAVLGDRYTLTEDATDLTLEQRLRAGRVLELAGSYGITWTRLHGQLAFVPFDERARIGRLRATALLDGRDGIIDPQRGYFHSTSYERGGGSGFDAEEYAFERLFLQQFVYVRAPLGSVLASALRYEHSSGRDLLSGGRLAAGGATTVRGYPEDLQGGLVSGQADVVEKLLVLNQELRFPVRGSLFGGAFLDHASLWRTGEGRVLSRTGVGLGLRFRTSVGVLRLDFGYPLQGDKRKLQLYFALGQPF